MQSRVHGKGEKGYNWRRPPIETLLACIVSELQHDYERIKMYPRGGPYHQGYGYGPPSHSQYSGHPNSYGSHSGSPYPPSRGLLSHSNVGQYQPQPGLTYGGSSSRQSHYPPPPRDGPPPARGGGMRGGPAGRGRGGHFANMSWTPGEGTKGGHIVQPGDKLKGREDAQSATPQPKATPAAGSPDDADNPFRPPADLRADDETASKRRKMSASGPSTSDVIPPPPPDDADSSAARANADRAAEKEAKPKISFSIKGRAAQASHDKHAPKVETSPLLEKRNPIAESPLSKSSAPKSSNYVGNTRINPPRKSSPPTTRKEKVRKKRIKQKPTLSEEFQQSQSVYFRKTGNESVVGSGTYGKVYKGIHVYTGRMVALKKIRMEGERDGVSMPYNP